MNKMFSFLAGTLCGALVGGVTALLLTPASGSDLKNDAINLWETVKADAVAETEATSQRLHAEYKQKINRNEPIA